MIVMAEGYVDRYFLFFIFFAYKCAMIMMGEGYVDIFFFFSFSVKSENWTWPRKLPAHLMLLQVL